MTSDRESVEKRLHDRIDDLVRELNEAERRLAENMQLNAVNLEITREAVKHSNDALECLRRVMGEAKGQPRVAPFQEAPRCTCGHWKFTHMDSGTGSCTACMCPDFQSASPRVAPAEMTRAQREADYLERRGGR